MKKSCHDMCAAADAIEALEARVAELTKERDRADEAACTLGLALTQQVHAHKVAHEQRARLLDAVNWCLGVAGDFQARQEGQGAYWWRPELQRRAGLEYDGTRFIFAATRPPSFPLQRIGTPGPAWIPWAVAEMAYQSYAAKFGTSQSLERLAERGGFSWSEMDLLLPSWRKLVESDARVQFKEAEKFEAWFTVRSQELMRTRREWAYLRPEMQLAWEAWTAAKQLQCQEAQGVEADGDEA